MSGHSSQHCQPRTVLVITRQWSSARKLLPSDRLCSQHRRMSIICACAGMLPSTISHSSFRWHPSRHTKAADRAMTCVTAIAARSHPSLRHAMKTYTTTCSCRGQATTVRRDTRHTRCSLPLYRAEQHTIPAADQSSGITSGLQPRIHARFAVLAGLTSARACVCMCVCACTGVAPPANTLRWVDSVVGGRNWNPSRMLQLYLARLRSLRSVDDMIGAAGEGTGTCCAQANSRRCRLLTVPACMHVLHLSLSSR